MNKPFYRLLICFIVGSIAVAVCYYAVDRPVAFWVHAQHFQYRTWAKIILTIPDILVGLAFLYVVFYLLRYAYQQTARLTSCLAIAASIILASFLKNQLKTAFSRTWPETWIGNPSLIRDDVYGFFPFHGTQAYAAFPSGHTSVAVAAAFAIGFFYPRLRWLAGIVALAVMVSLIFMNYHFVGDVVGGCMVGAFTAWSVCSLLQKTNFSATSNNRNHLA